VVFARNSKPLREVRLRLIEGERVGEFEAVRAPDYMSVALNEYISTNVRIVARFADEHSSARGVTAHLTQARSERLYCDISHVGLADPSDGKEKLTPLRVWKRLAPTTPH
jgi:hypothetical protein